MTTKDYREEMRRVYTSGMYKHLEDKARCVKEVGSAGRSFISYQCKKKRGYGTDGLFCKQHQDTDAKYEYYDRFELVKLKI